MSALIGYRKGVLVVVFDTYVGHARSPAQQFFREAFLDCSGHERLVLAVDNEVGRNEEVQFLLYFLFAV